LLVLIVGFLFTGIEPSVSGIIIRPSDLILLLLISLEGIFCVNSPQGLPQFYGLKNRITILFIVLVIYKFIDGAYKTDFKTSFVELAQASEYLIFYFFVIKYLSNYNSRERFFKFLQISTLAVALFAAFYHISKGKLTDYKDLDEARISFGICALFSFYFYLKRGTFFSTFIFILAFVLMLLSGERKGWLAFAFGAIYLNFFFEGKLKLTTIFFIKRIIAPAILLIVFLITSSYLSSDKYYLQQQSTFEEIPSLISNFQENLQYRQSLDYNAFASRSDAARYYVFMTGIYEFEKDPVFGIGTGNFRKIVIEVSPDPWIRNGAHNEYLNTLVEYGSIGLIIFIILLLIIFKTIRRIESFGDMRDQHRSFIMAIFIYMSVINFFDGGGDAINYVFILLPAALTVSLMRERNYWQSYIS